MRPTPLLTPTQKLTLGCPTLDTFLSGGIPCNSLTEIVAESGSGKTQLCLQLLLTSQLPLSLGGLSAASLYLHTEFPFPSRRLRRLSTSFLSFHTTHLPPQPYNPLDNILVHGVHDAQHLLDVLLKLDSFLVTRNYGPWPVKLIVIDSIAAVFRGEFENTPAEMRQRSGMFFKMSAILRGLAWKFGLAVVVTNQVVDVMGGGDGVNAVRIGNLGSLWSSGRRVCPALGLAWANCVNTRLFLSRSEEVLGENNGLVEEDGRNSVMVRTRRFVHVVFAPHLAPSSCEFMILREGVFGIDRTRQVVLSRVSQ